MEVAARGNGYHITSPSGSNFDLDDAARQALREMIGWIGKLTGLSRDEAYALSSFAVDLHVTQTVNNVKGVHAMIAKSILTGSSSPAHAGDPVNSAR